LIPLKDTLPRRSFPFVNLFFIAGNIAAFAYEVSLGREVNQLVSTYGLVPYRITHLLSQLSVKQVVVPFFTSLFLHGGIIHLIGNMWYLWIFGDNVEDKLGHFRYFLFYFFCGWVASLIHIIFNSHSSLPCVGASGCIAGVLGAFLIIFPKARIVTLVPIWIFLKVMELPAFLVLSLWFLIQFLNGTAAVAVSTTGGIAHWAHIGGFLAGVFVVCVIRRE
jgi:hypothetical protein